MQDDFQIVDGGRHGPTTLLRVVGRLDARSAPLLQSRCAEIRGKGESLVINLSGVTFVASSGLGSLLTLAEEFREGPGAVRFACLSQPVRSVIDLLNLDQFLPIDGTEAEALQTIGA